MADLLQASFSGGELSPSLYARVDLARWATSLRTCRNCIVHVYGGVVNRPGLQFLQEISATSKSKLVPFIFSKTQAYMLEFAPGKVRVYANGAPVTDGASVVITGVAVSAGVRTVTTSGAHGLVAGDVATIASIVATGVLNLNGSWLVESAPTTSTFTVRATTSGQTGTYTSGGTVEKAVQLVNPYAEADLPKLKWTQSADVLTVVHPDYVPYEFQRLSASSFSYTEFVPTRGPFQDINVAVGTRVYSSAAWGEVTLTANDDIFVTGAHENTLFYLEEEFYESVPPWEPNKEIAASTVNPFGAKRRSDGKVYKCVTDAAASTDGTRTGTVRPTHIEGVQSDGDSSPIPSIASAAGVQWLYEHSGYGIARINSVSSGTQAAATVLVRFPDNVVGGPTTAQGPWTMTGDDADVTLTSTGATSNNVYDYELSYDGVVQSPSLYSVNAGTPVMTFFDAPSTGVAVSARQLGDKNYSSVWAFGAWSPGQGYPLTVTYYADRLIFAASAEASQTIWMSGVSDYKNFGKSTPPEDSDAITITLNARQINSINDLVPLDSLVALTAAAAWRITEGADQLLIPSTVGFKPQLYRGASDVIPAKIVGDSALFVQANNTKIRDLRYQFDVDKFAGNEITLFFEHLLDKGKKLVAMDYSEEPFNVLWSARSDGALLSITYMREQEVVGGAPHDTLNGLVEDVAVIPEDGEDAVYLIVKRTVNGADHRYIERMHSRYMATPSDAFFVDSGLSYDGRNTSATTMVLTAPLGLWSKDDDLTLDASAASFDAGDVGDVIILAEELRLEIIAYISTTRVTVRPDRTVLSGYQGVATTNWSFARDEFAGLDHLEGEEVTVLGDAQVLTPQTVLGGRITVPVHSAVVHIGVGITADVETLDINVAGAASVRAVEKSIPKVAIIVRDTAGLLTGPNASDLVPYKQRENEDYDEETELLTGLADPVYITNSWNKDARVFIRHTDPLPMSILGIIPSVDFTDQD